MATFTAQVGLSHHQVTRYGEWDAFPGVSVIE